MDFGQRRVNTILVNCPQCCIGQAQANPAILALNPESAMLQIRQKAPLGFVVGMGNMVAGHRFLASDFTYSCHDDILQNSGSAYYIPISKILKSNQSPLGERHGRPTANNKMIQDFYVHQRERLL